MKAKDIENEMKPHEHNLIKTIKEYASINRLIVDLKEVIAIEWVKKEIAQDSVMKEDIILPSNLDRVVKFHMKSGRVLTRRTSAKLIKRIQTRYKKLNKKRYLYGEEIFDFMEDE